MSTAMTSGGGHHHHSVHPSDLEVLDSLTNVPSTSTGHVNGVLNERRPSRRPLDTLQALRRPPIDPIVLAASLSSGPHVTRHHFLHSFGPKTESKQMTRSQRAQKRREEEEEEEARQRASSSRLGTRPRAGSYANCDADDDIGERARRANEISQSILEELGEAQTYQSKQMPRSERLKKEKEAQEARERQKVGAMNPATEEGKAVSKKIDKLKQQEARPKAVRLASQQLDDELLQRKSVIEAKQNQQAQVQQQLAINRQSTPITETVPATPAFSSIVRPPPLTIRCYARTRIPTPHGEIFCHLYRNNRDQKEHLALVIDPAQNAADDRYANAPGQFIRSKTLDEVWGPTETEMERIVRGAYVGRLGPTNQQASKQGMLTSDAAAAANVEPPLVRIHSECYTGETIGSQRCDCGEQLDEAIRLIHADARPAKGVVVYLRQEGRGIGLLDKLMAYNLQDMGHDTVAANILLGHLADARKYDIAAEILRDLGVGSCRLLTNNPDKMEALEAEGISVNKRVAMVPRIWRMHAPPRRKLKNSQSKKSSRRKARKSKGLDSSIVSQFDGGSTHATGTTDEDGDGEDYDDEDDSFSDSSRDSYLEHHQRRAGATMIGASLTRGPELEKYLRTKVEKMGHLLDVPAEQVQSALEQSQPESGPAKERKHRPRQRDTTDSSIGKFDTSDGDTAGTDDEPLMDAAELQEYITSQSQSHEEEGGEEILINEQKEKY
ncbi:uncharacterized protein FA14DRAFT_159428 [Meira miltonrushii]|uniref:GTP cyclohydrolase II n=1 Tax=Meira miltonrushii TaxID=1280837 RepID=A0A316VJT8_9BASI|nr:uncharacterized protein FA14DRAFT_159428 [Meira miltonrushii]PWN37328.1 hypothetical protein FA14DRAFT_159428 [Meira miltonrushii]